MSIKPSGEVTYLEKSLLRLLDYVVTMGRISSGEAADVLGIPKRTAQSKLRKLLDLKLIKKVPLGPKTYYVAA